VTVVHGKRPDTASTCARILSRAKICGRKGELAAMTSTGRGQHDSIRSPTSSAKLRAFGALFAIVFPTIITWGYFVLAARFPTGVQQAIYLSVKTIQFVFPLVWVWFVLREPLRFGRPTSKGVALGAAFSIIVVATGWFVFDLVLRDTSAFATAAPKIHEKIVQFGIDAMWKYAVLAVFYSLIHSLLEEYYWRWFVFRQLRAMLPLWPAILISALAFMGHHVVVLDEFFSELPWLAWLFSAAVAVGGVFWAWLYDKTGSLYGPWLSHLLIDAGIFWIGYDLVRDALVHGG
jgi:membrane protease YdiL (CAAX protease family)